MHLDYLLVKCLLASLTFSIIDKMCYLKLVIKKEFQIYCFSSFSPYSFTECLTNLICRQYFKVLTKEHFLSVLPEMLCICYQFGTIMNCKHINLKVADNLINNTIITSNNLPNRLNFKLRSHNSRKRERC